MSRFLWFTVYIAARKENPNPNPNSHDHCLLSKWKCRPYIYTCVYFSMDFFL